MPPWTKLLGSARHAGGPQLRGEAAQTQQFATAALGAPGLRAGHRHTHEVPRNGPELLCKCLIGRPCFGSQQRTHLQGFLARQSAIGTPIDGFSVQREAKMDVEMDGGAEVPQVRS